MSYPKVLSERDTMAAVRDGFSLARFGDGEIKIALGRDAKSQRFDPRLARILKEALATENRLCITGIPNIGGLTKSPKEAFWADYRRNDVQRLYRRKVYGSSFVTRPDSAPRPFDAPYWMHMMKLWAGKSVTLVRGSGKSFTAAELEKDAKEVNEIMCPRQHAFEEYDSLFDQLRTFKKGPVLLCCGATATALAWELSKIGVHAVDLGHAGMFARKLSMGLPMDVTEEDKNDDK